MLGKVGLQHVEEEGCGLANQIALQKEVGDGVEVERGWVELPNLNRKVHSALRVCLQSLLQQEGVIRGVSNLLCILAQLLELPAGRKHLHNLGR
eukprot:1163391-Prorocentrum_minimum.AAC.7